MKKVRFTESQIGNEFERGIDAQILCCQHGISKATFYNWRKKYSGMETTQLKRGYFGSVWFFVKFGESIILRQQNLSSEHLKARSAIHLSLSKLPKK